MEDRFQELIEKLRTAQGRSKKNEKLISLLEEKRRSMPEDATLQDAEDAITQVMRLYFSESSDSVNEEEEEEDSLPADNEVYMAETAKQIRSFLDSHEWKYSEEKVKDDLIVYKLGFDLEQGSFAVTMFLEDQPRVIRLDVNLPVNVDKTYEYIFCKEILKENYPRRFGGLQYDERDGELTYRYAFSVKNGFFTDEFEKIFYSIINSSADSYEVLRRFVVGRFKPKEVIEILEKVNIIINDLNEYR